MKRYDLKTADAASLTSALEAAGIIDANGLVAPGVILDVIGPIPCSTGKVDAEGVPEMEMLDGYHANLYATLTEEQEAVLPIIPIPDNPYRKLAGE